MLMTLHVTSKKKKHIDKETIYSLDDSNLLNCIQEKHRLYRQSVISPVLKTEFLNYKKKTT